MLTSDGDADRVVVLVEDRDVHIRREVASTELRREVSIHVERVLVDVQFMAGRPSMSVRQVEGKGVTHFPIAMMS